MFRKFKKIFFVGIGGIGISALARVFKQEGLDISGSDLVFSEITQKLEQEGIKVAIGHWPENLFKETDLLVYSLAVPEDNPEREQARSLGIPQMSYAEALGEYARDKKVIAVAGTNGKTTTTAMLATILIEARMDPTAVVGSEVLAWKSNARLGKGSWLVLEADEYRRAFLNYHPKIGVITNIEKDHLDYFRDLNDIKKAFSEFTSQIKLNGVLAYNFDNSNTVEVCNKFLGEKVSFGFSDQANVRPSLYPDLKLQVPGDFNLSNAMAAAAACQSLGVPLEVIRQGLEKFSGTWRRFQKVGKINRTEIISDYAHHPAGIRVTLQMAAEIYRGKKVLIVFQPHQHNRTKMLFSEFVKSFCQSSFSDFIISEIFDVSGREERQDQDISSQDLVTEIRNCGKNVSYANDLADVEAQVKKIAQSYQAVIIIGAGDIYKVANTLVSKSKQGIV